MNESSSTLAALLRNARERLGRRNGARVRQGDVAEHADITVEWYARIERGNALPSFDVLSRIASALCLSSRERVEALRFVAPELLGRDDADSPGESAGRATRELRAYRRFHRRAEAASTPDELIDMAVATVMDGLPQIPFASCMSRSPANDRWLHRSAVRPDVAEAINQSAPLDDGAIRSAQLDQDGLRFIGSSDYGAASIPHLRDRNTHTELRSGFGVRIPLNDGFLGFCRKERGAPNTDHILFLASISNILALTLRQAHPSTGSPFDRLTLRQAHPSTGSG
jgi:transcriptional regulator with XRE-family HTH domain